MPFAGGVESRRRREKVPQPLARSQSSTHSLRCSYGYTALGWAIANNKADAAAYLRSIGAPE
jgi:ankyrin repeat protein